MNKNIIFAALGKEECELCITFKEHQCLQQGCEVCLSYEQHKIKAIETRSAYKEDSSLTNDNENAYYSVDLQKVIMLPRLPGIKTVAFTRRVIAYNETFAPLGDKKKLKDKSELPTALTWHQAEGGRSAQEVCSTYYNFIKSKRDISNFTFWVDNCSSQNKFWFLYSLFCFAVNSSQLTTLSITLKYFERGHSFMSADSYHHLVEKGMNEMKNVYDFQDFVNVLDSNGKSIVLKSSDFFYFPRGVSEKSKFTEGKPFLDDISIVKFQRGTSKMFWKTSFADLEFKSSEFLQKKMSAKCLKGLFELNPLYPTGAPGIESSRKNDIITKLIPLMPENRRSFWQNLKES